MPLLTTLVRIYAPALSGQRLTLCRAMATAKIKGLYTCLVARTCTMLFDVANVLVCISLAWFLAPSSITTLYPSFLFALGGTVVEAKGDEMTRYGPCYANYDDAVNRAQIEVVVKP